MTVRRATAYSLLKAFAQLEFELKKIPDFVGGDERNAKVCWQAVDAAVRVLPPGAFLDRVLVQTKLKMLGGDRNRPMVHVLMLVGGANRAVFQRRNLPFNDAEALAGC